MAKPQAEFSEGHKSVTTLKDQHVSSGKKQGVQWDSIPDHVRFKQLFPKHASKQGLFRCWLSFNHPIEADKLLKIGLFPLVDKKSFFKKCNHHLAFCTNPYITNQELLLIQSWTYLPQQVFTKKNGLSSSTWKKILRMNSPKRINSFFNPGYFCFIWLKNKNIAWWKRWRKWPCWRWKCSSHNVSNCFNRMRRMTTAICGVEFTGNM